MATGFRIGDIPRIPGTSARSRYLETSVGSADVDALLGGSGLPLSSIYLIDEDRSRAYSFILAKNYIAEGVVWKHDIFIASVFRNPEEFMQDLPDVSDSASIDSKTASAGYDPALKIAWRYATIPKMESSLGATQRRGEQFDLSKKMKREKLEQCNVSFYPGNDKSSYHALPNYTELYQQIKNKLSEEQFSVVPSKFKKQVLRIIIEGVGGPQWQDPENDLKFILHLRSIINSSYASVMLIINSSGMKAERKMRLFSYCDLVVHLEAVENDSTVQKLSDHFDGYFRLLKLPTIVSVATHCPASSDLVFQLQKRKFDIRILHLPPASDVHMCDKKNF